MISSSIISFLPLQYTSLSNGETLAYRESGSGPQTLLLLHGTLSSSSAFLSLAPKLSLFFRVIAPDMRGFGYSSYNKPFSSHEELADDIKLFIDKLQINKCSILGWSTAGPVAFYFGLKYPENTERIILFAAVGPQGVPFYKFDSNGKMTNEVITKKEELMQQNLFVRNVVKVLERKDKKVLKRFLDAALFHNRMPPEEVYEMILDETLRQKCYLETCVANAFVNVTAEDTKISKGRDLVKSFNKEVLILHGEDDIVVNVEAARKWKEVLGDLAKLEVIAKCGHNPLDTYLKKCTEMVREFTEGARAKL